jgi:hypothetical protein
MKFKNLCIAVFVSIFSVSSSRAAVFINEIFINPPGSNDDTREFVELLGTPGMKLDGYAVTLVSGGLTKYHLLNSVNCSELPNPPEVDEFFSLDGLSLGSNGILVLGIGPSGAYPSLLSDTIYQRWTLLWQSNPSDPHGKLSNDGSNTCLLIRNRPGSTQAHGDIADVRWGKDQAPIDSELITPVDTDVCENSPVNGAPCSTDADCFGGDCVPGTADQYGDGNIDRGGPSGLASPCDQLADLKGTSTFADVTDDLEVVDEVSYEDSRGWQYDMDSRHVDNGSTLTGLSYRHVHDLNDPQGFNPDCLSRVDYRTKGAGWPPAPGGVGEMGNGNNWQDTATEQWIRGESKAASATCPPPGGTPAPPFYFDNCPNTNPDSIQPYQTNVPRWLADGSGVEYNFSINDTYEIMAGRVNPLAIAYIPGDADRDGDTDAADISKIASVFGNDDWIYSNSYAASPEGDGGDPAVQTRPWDVDQTGINGIEPADLQWTLNFQGNTDGHIVGVRYDSTTPSATGVVMNSGAAVTVTITAAGSNGCGRSVSGLFVGDLFQINVSAQLTAGANNTAGSQNGVMQFAHDITVSSGGVLQLISVQPINGFITTRAAIQAPQGVNGDLGVKLVNGYTTSFALGVTVPAIMYRVIFKAVALGSANINITAASSPKFAAGTPRGVKIGHTRTTSPFTIGDPGATVYPAAIGVTVVPGLIGDINGDAVVNLADVSPFVSVLLGTPILPAHVPPSDINCDGQRDGLDIPGFVDALLP